MVPNNQPAADLRANADLLRRLAAAIGLNGESLVEVYQCVVSDAQAEVAPIDSAARLDPSSETPGEG